jgi:hypothetical protein
MDNQKCYHSNQLCINIKLFNDKVQEMKDHFNAFVYEMDLLIHELDSIQNNKGENENERG